MSRRKEEPRRLLRRFRIAWAKIQVFFGFKVWAKMQYNRPKRALCVLHGIQMKRVKKTELGAVYHCWKCQRSYMLQGGRNKLVPV